MRRRRGRVFRVRVAFVVILVGAVMLGGVMYSVLSIVPNVRKLATNRAKEIAIIKVHEAIEQKFTKDAIDYDDIVKFTYSPEGEICAVSNNISSVNVLKAELVKTVTEAISGIKKSEISLPLGSLSGIDFLYGTGPFIPVEIVPYGYAVADIVTDFRASGINQTIFELTAKIDANVSVLMPLMKSGAHIETSVPMISTVIVGDVPQSYTNVERYGEEYEEDVLQLAE